MHIGDWQDRAACNGQDVDDFFDPGGLLLGAPTKETRLTRWRAKQTCARCPVAQACIEYADRVGIPFGVYGGLDQHERATLRKRDTERGVSGTAVAQIGHRLVADGFSVAEAAERMDLPEAYVQSRMDKHADAPVVVMATREYEAWASAWIGMNPAQISRWHNIPHSSATEMCAAVDKVPEYRGPKGRDRYVRRDQPIAC